MSASPSPPPRQDPFEIPAAVDRLSSTLVARGFRYTGATVKAGEKQHYFQRGGLRVRCRGNAVAWRVELHYRLFAEDEWFGAEIFRAYLELQAGLVIGRGVEAQADFVRAQVESIARLVSRNEGLPARLRTLRAIATEPPAGEDAGNPAPSRRDAARAAAACQKLGQSRSGTFGGAPENRAEELTTNHPTG